MSQSAELSTANASTRACQNCAKAKAKCVSQPLGSLSNGRCARCERLDKECVPVPRSTRKRRAPNTKTGKLEQKIENLVNLLANAQGVHLNLEQQQLTPPESHSQPELPNTAQEIKTPTFSGQRIPWTPHHSALNTTTYSGSQVSSGAIQVQGATILNIENPSAPSREHFSSSIWNLPDHEGEALLCKFKDVFIPHFPFIPLSSNMSLAEFKIRRPHVLKAIWTVAFQDNRKRQIEMGKEVMVDISTAMFVRAEKNLDMLECLILMNAWSYFISPMPPATKSTAYYQLTLALLYDLKLTRPMREVEGSGDILADFRTRDVPECMTNDTARRSSDDCRALLCCYHLGSIYALSVKRTEGLPFSAYVEFCCQTLEQRSEHESDLLLVALVRLECLIRPIDELLTKKSFSDDHSAPIAMHIKAIRMSLERFWDSLPPSIQQHPIMTLNYQSNTVYLYEPCFYSSLFTSSLYAPSPSPRLDLMHACLLSCKTLFDQYLLRPIHLCYGTSLVDLAPLGRGFTSLLKLCLVDEPGWDLPLIRQAANLSFYLESLLAIYQQVGNDLDGRQREACRHSCFSGCARAIGVVKSWYECKVSSEEQSMGEMPVMGEMVGGQGWPLDDTYWLDFMGDWTLQA